MSLIGYALANNSRENTACYGAGEPGALGFEATIVNCSEDGAIARTFDWAMPGSDNGISVSCFDYQKAPGNSTKPRPDAVKVLTIENIKNGGGYTRIFVPDNYTMADFLAACRAGTPIPAVTIPAPIVYYTDTVQNSPVLPPATTYGAVQIPVLTGSNTTYTATIYGKDALGAPVVFSPTTSTGATPAALAANMQTNWASELGAGTFVATGNSIAWHATNGTKGVGFSITQS